MMVLYSSDSANTFFMLELNARAKRDALASCKPIVDGKTGAELYR